MGYIAIEQLGIGAHVWFCGIIGLRGLLPRRDPLDADPYLNTLFTTMGPLLCTLGRELLSPELLLVLGACAAIVVCFSLRLV